MILQAVNAMTVSMSGVSAHNHAILNLLHDESGQGQVEYGLVVMLVSLCAIASTKSMSTSLVTIWQGIATTMSANM